MNLHACMAAPALPQFACDVSRSTVRKHAWRLPQVSTAQLASMHGINVPHEQVVGLGAVPADLEQLHEVIELPMDVTTCRTRQVRHGSGLSGPMSRHDLEEDPHIVTGASTLCTLLSSTRTSSAFWQSDLTSDSLRTSQRFSCSIHRSNSDCPDISARQIDPPSESPAFPPSLHRSPRTQLHAMTR